MINHFTLKLLRYVAVIIAATFTFNHFNPWVGIILGIAGIVYLLNKDINWPSDGSLV